MEPRPKPANDVDPDANERLRLVSNLSLDYVLRAVNDLRTTTGLNLVESIVFAAIVAANNGGLAPQEEELPAARRRPISVFSLAASVGIPPETTRRYVQRLERAGLVTRTPRGVVAVGTAGRDERMNELRRRNLANLRRLYRTLANAGVDLA